MSKVSILASFWFVGFVVGFFAWFAKTPFLQFFENFGISASISQSLIAGLFGSVVMVLTVIVWAFLSSPK